VEGRNFHVATDHKPLTFAIASQTNHHTPRQIRHLDYISQFTTDIRRIRVEDNSVADTLSQVSAIHDDTVVPVSFQDISKAQRNDSELSQLQKTNTSLKLQATPIPTSEDTIV